MSSSLPGSEGVLTESEHAVVVLSGRLDRERARSEFRRAALETFLLYLITYELPIDRVRTLVDKVVADGLAGFLVLDRAGYRREMCQELLERLTRVQDAVVERAAAASGEKVLSKAKEHV